ncbi:AMP-binding protein [Pseudooceanicola sp. MF1-13]|uniref:AMP-binding protein n=1 Tax=Pseudooceanicola sp. MF1-13 TaxID=3379095 RepID=UPI003891EFE1
MTDIEPQVNLQESPTDAALALRALRRYPDRIAFRWDGGELSYRQTEQLIAGLQAELRDMGVGPGRNVAILSANRVEAWCTVIAAQALGAAISNLHPLGAADMHVAQVRELAPAVVVSDADSHRETAAQIAKTCPEPHHVFLGGGGADDLVARAKARADVTITLVERFDLPGTLNFTGGTTGRPKSVVRTQGAIGQMTLNILADFHLPNAPRYLAVAPISHVGGVKLVATLLRGGMIYMVRGFDPARVLELIETQRISYTVLVPTMIYALLDHSDIDRRDLSSLELLLYGASPMSPSRLRQGIDRFGPIFAQFYGQTECYPITFLDPEDHDPDRPELLLSCGRPATGAVVKLLDDDGQEVPVGEAGEICVRSPTVMIDYRDRPEETTKALYGGWLHTGDIARADAEGRLYIVDRKKDMIVSGGFNIYPKELEDVIYEDPAVSMAAVIGVPHEKWGEAVVAYVVPRAGQEIDTDRLHQTIKSTKGAIYCPKAIEVVTEMPQTPLGKIDKVALRAPHWEGQARQV